MGGGERRRLSRRDRDRVGRAVQRAEAATGLQIAVAFGDTPGDAAADAERLARDAGLQERPGVLVLVAPARRELAVVTAPVLARRLPDQLCAGVVEHMLTFLRDGRLTDGLVAGLDAIALLAGPPRPGDPVPAPLPDVFDAGARPSSRA